MGLDIQLVVEASEFEDFHQSSGIVFAEPPRNTKLFFAMTGIRGKPCRFPTRGFPDTASSMAVFHFGRAVVDNLDEVDSWGTACISKKWALASANQGASRPLKQGLVSSPEFISPSWLRLSELREVLELASVEHIELSLELAVIVELMASIEARGLRSRIVFWFSE
jgi:hypothetical protein